MKQADTIRRTQQRLAGSVMLGLLLMAGGAQAETYNLATTISSGTCTVTASESVVTLPDVERDVLDNGTLQQMHPLTISAQKCLGVGGRSTSPVLLVSGTTATAPAGTSDYLFNSGGANSTAKGYGIVVSTQNDTTWNTANLLKNGDAFPLLDINTDNTLYVAVGCGDTTTCSLRDADHASGSLSAGITFTFKYQ
ncbi:fimbrial protein [Serratia marcescens]|uniref:fimbrial protein n=1 Tax=Serratia marcescens TaxID=615 RepID=UPI0017879351|nr:fimbrial protein [Serratia marcescens]